MNGIVFFVVDDQRAVQEVGGEDGGLVTGLWIAIGATSLLLGVVLGLFFLIKFNILGKNKARSRRRREAVPLAQSNGSNFNSTTSALTAVSTISGGVPYSYSVSGEINKLLIEFLMS